jgi:hypothetical protein
VELLVTLALLVLAAAAVDRFLRRPSVATGATATTALWGLYGRLR